MSRDNEKRCAGTVGNGWQHYSASAIKTERTEERNFPRDELDAYRDLRLTGLAPRSRDWLIRAPDVMWERAKRIFRKLFRPRCLV
jgi:hypothetical protein